MLIQTEISLAVRNARLYSGDLLNELVALQRAGEDSCKCENQIILLQQWTRILIDYLSNNFDNNGNITPIVTCLTIEQVESIVGKINIMLGATKYPISDYWVLEYGYWSDTSRWRDSETWNDINPLN